ncbi:hypothetical protein CMK19_21045 [Candidatus Poribacteria bacterium]|nr:hypothetical protein [Candidatus Poribacteria bacterium]
MSKYISRVLLLLSVFTSLTLSNAKTNPFPYAEEGLTKREASVHLLNRFTFGPKPNQIEQVMALGLEQWFYQQMEPQKSSVTLQNKLSHLAITNMTTRDILNRHPSSSQLRALARQEGLIPKEDSKTNWKEIKSQLQKFSRNKGFRTQKQLIKELKARKILRAVYSDQQLVEVLVDFWFNHFNVSSTHRQARVWLPSYEEEVIRPNVLRNFRTILSATSKHPAMLYYLDNHQSNAKLENQFVGKRRLIGKKSMMPSDDKGLLTPKNANRKKNWGINENYARELLELHTLGIDGNYYTQDDILTVARSLTGWKVNTKYARTNRSKKQTSDTYFTFVSRNHDIKAKMFLGNYLPPNRGIEDGEEILDIVAQHSSTARHISNKLAIRFVTEKPTEAYIESLAQVFLASNGDLTQMMIAIAYSTEFWAEAKKYNRTKSPFRMVIGTLRAMNAEIISTIQLANRIAGMGQDLYACQPPTGYLDTGNNWINASSVLHRTNFGLNLLTGHIRGLTIKLGDDLLQQSSSTQIETLCSRLLPTQEVHLMSKEIMLILAKKPDLNKKKSNRKRNKQHRNRWRRKTDEWQLMQIAGLIIGSPQFQVY